MSEKTHDPSPQRLRDARKKGQIPRSKLLSSGVVTAAGLIGTLAFANETAVQFKQLTVTLLTTQLEPTSALKVCLVTLARCAAPTLAAAFFAALGVSVVVAGLQVNVEAVSPKLENLDPISGAKKLFSPKQAIEVLKGLVVAALVLLLVWRQVEKVAPLALRVLNHDGVQGLSALFSLLTPILTKATVLLVVLGIGDYALAKRRHKKDLMMSHDEVKQEHKSSEGDPKHKAERKALHKKLSNQGPARGVQKATAVVVNPTHIAVALRFDESELDAPYIVAKGREEDALKIRTDAKALGIPIVKDIPLARSLVHFDVGEEVPEELYKAAAAVLKVALEATESDSKETP